MYLTFGSVEDQSHATGAGRIWTEEPPQTFGKFNLRWSTVGPLAPSSGGTTMSRHTASHRSTVTPFECQSSDPKTAFSFLPPRLHCNRTAVFTSSVTRQSANGTTGPGPARMNSLGEVAQALDGVSKTPWLLPCQSSPDWRISAAGEKPWPARLSLWRQATRRATVNDRGRR